MAGELIQRLYKVGKRSTITIPKLWLRFQAHKSGQKIENVRMKMQEDDKKLPLLIYPEYKREGTHGDEASPMFDEYVKVFHVGKSIGVPMPTIWIRRQCDIGEVKSFSRVRLFIEKDRITVLPKFGTVQEPEEIAMGDTETKAGKELAEEGDFDRFVGEVERGRGEKATKA